jgi:DNA-binding SARP family transcriptional activator
MIECRLLGPVTLTCDGAPPPPELLWKKNLALFVYLALSPRGRRSRDHLVGLLWGDKEETAARHSLREAVRVVRKAVGEGALNSEGDQIILDASAVRLDLTTFEARVTSGDWDGAAALVQGELAEGFSVPDASGFEEWLAAERLQWGRRSREVLVRAGERCLARGDDLGALALGERVLAANPASGSAVQLVMRASAIRGDVGSALATYERSVGHLQTSLGSGPSGELAGLAERLRAGHRLRHSPRQGGERLVVRRAPLVTSGGTLQRMVGEWEGVRDGRSGRVILLAAPPGYGKTRLSTELVSRAALDGAGVAAIRAVPGDRERQLGGITGLLRGGMLDFAGAATARPEALAALAAEVPEWGERFGAAVKGATAIALPDAFHEVLRASAVEAPVVLVIDDADSLDPASFALLEEVVRELPKLSILLILTSSGTPSGLSLDPIGTRIGRDVEGASLTLGPLDDAALEALARAILPKSTDDQIARVVRRVAADSAGIPLLAVELLTAIAAGLEVAGAPTAWPASHRTLDQTRPGELPDLLIAAIRVGFRALSKDAQSALAAAAVLGDRVDGARIGRGAQLADPSAALDELEWTRWLVAEGRGYAFVARIVREVVLRDLVTAGQIQRIKDAAGPDKE